MRYRVFTKKGCGTCRSVTALLKQKGVEFEEIDVATDAGLAVAQKLGIKTSGAVIDENNKVIPFKDLSRVIAENLECEACTV